MWRIKVQRIKILVSLGGKAIYYISVIIIILNTQVVLQMLYGEYTSQLSRWCKGLYASVDDRKLSSCG